MCSDNPLITLKGGLVVHRDVITRVLDLEGRGCTFTVLDDGHFRIDPVEALTEDDVEFVRTHRGAVLSVIAYEPPAA